MGPRSECRLPRRAAWRKFNVLSGTLGAKQPLGAGGKGEVYFARSRPDREVAIKIIPALSDGLSVPEELVILVVPAVAAADVGDELQALDPLHLLEPELRLVAQP